MKKIIETPSYIVGENILYTAKSYLVGRFSPAIEKIILPEYELQKGSLEIVYDGKITKSESMMSSDLKKKLIRLKNRYKPTKITERILIDYRKHSPGNWSHTTNLLIPFAFYILREFREYFDKNKPIFILDKNIPKYICDFFDLFEIEYIKIDNDVEGCFIRIEYYPFSCLRCLSYKWVKNFIAKHKSYLSLLIDHKELPKKVFISRKDTRKIINEEEVELFLSDKGFKKIYAENLSVIDQLKVYIHATDIVAVHGAALGPMIYRPPNKLPLKIVEIFNPGHVNDYFRCCADQINAKWVGVRGRLNSHLFPDAYNFSKPFLKHSLKDFFVDIESLNAGLSDLEAR